MHKDDIEYLERLLQTQPLFAGIELANYAFCGQINGHFYYNAGKKFGILRARVKEKRDADTSVHEW